MRGPQQRLHAKVLSHPTAGASVEKQAAYNVHHFSAAGAKQMELRQKNSEDPAPHVNLKPRNSSVADDAQVVCKPRPDDDGVDVAKNHQTTANGIKTPLEGDQRSPGEKKKKNSFIIQNYKTEICRSHRQTGLCEYDNSCQFAHGIHELRPRHYGLKYKTQECKNYHSEGYCRFGSRCKFIHDEHRIRVANDEFWLVSPSENLVRVEVVENPSRQAELAKLFNLDEPTSTNFVAPGL